MQSELNQLSLLRVKDVLAIVPVSRTTWWEGVKAGRYPQPIKIGVRSTAWRRQDVAAWIEARAAASQSGGA